MNREKSIRIAFSDAVPFADTRWESVGSRLLFRARRSLALSLWGDTQTVEFPTVSKAVHVLRQESGAAYSVAAWRYFSDAQPLDAYPCKLVRDGAWTWARRYDADSSDSVRPYLGALESLLVPKKPANETLILSERYLSRTMRIRAIAHACAWYEALSFTVGRTNTLATARGWDAHHCLEQMYRFLGQADAFDVALVQRAQDGQQARERTLGERRTVALEAIRRSLNDYAHLSAPKFADELVSPNIKISHRELVKLINQERRKRVALPGNTDV